VKNGLWGQIQGDPNLATRLSNNAEVNAATKMVEALPSVSVADLQASSDFASFVQEIRAETASAKIGGRNQEYEKFLSFGRNEGGEIIVTGISLVGPQGGNVAGLLGSGTIAIAHAHYQGLYQPPHGADNSITKLRNIPSFVIGSTGRNTWEIGRVDGNISIRTVLPNNSFGRWEAFQSDPRNYRIYNDRKYP
jgi:hypothetical protein